MQIALRIVGRWLAWLLGGALWGAVCGAIVGSCFALIFLVIFDVIGSTIRAPLRAVVYGALGAGAYVGILEGAATGAIAFAIAGLTRVWRPSAPTERELRRTCRAAFWTSIAGAFYGALAGSLWILMTTVRNPFRPGAWWLRADNGFIYGSLIGFGFGLALGALAPGWSELVTRAMKSLLPRAKEGQNGLE